MAQKLYEESNIEAIAEAIREKNGTTNKYTVAQMADAIRALSTGGGGGGTDTITFTIPDTYDDDTGEEARTTYTTKAGNTWTQAISDKDLPSSYVIMDLTDYGYEGVMGVVFTDWDAIVRDPDTRALVVPTNPIEAKDYYLA